MFLPTTVIAAGKHALLIGIQDYSQTDFSALPGPANDLKLMAGVLRERFGFQADDFIILKDAQATHTGIENAFMTLIERVNTGDFVYIYYSGHGSQTADLNPLEQLLVNAVHGWRGGTPIRIDEWATAQVTFKVQ